MDDRAEAPTLAPSTWLGLSGPTADTREALFGGVGKVRVWNLAGRRTVEPFSAVLACELESGASVGAHVQQRDPEILLVLEGHGVAEVAGVPHELGPGTLVHIAFGKRLSLRNATDSGPLRYLIIKSRASTSTP